MLYNSSFTNTISAQKYMKTWHLFCEVQTSVIGEAGAVIGLFLLIFFKPCEHGQPEHPGRLFLCPSKGTIMNRNRLNRGSIAASHDRTESVEGRGDHGTEGLCRDQTLDYVNILTCIFHLYVKTIIWAFIYKKVEFFMHFWLPWCLRLLNLYLVCLYVCTLHYNVEKFFPACCSCLG